MPSTIQIGALTLDVLEQVAQQAAPSEACALLLGETTGGKTSVYQVVVTNNVTMGDSGSSFEIDPAIHIEIQKAARAGGPQIVGVWHSHPSGAARPSETDRAQSTAPGWIWLISAGKGTSWKHAAFRAQVNDPHIFDECVFDVTTP